MTAMRPMPNIRRITRQVGLTLVELMVALTIGLFLTLGLFLMMSDSSRTFKIQDDFARMQENAVAALRNLGDSYRHAGFYGVLARTATLPVVGTAFTIAAGTDCGNVLTSGVPVFGFVGLTTANVNATVPCINAANFREPSPVLVMRMGSGLPVGDPNGDGNLSDGLAALAGSATTVFLQSDAAGGQIFLGSSYAALRAAGQHKTVHGGADAPIFPYQMHVYYIRPCSRPTGGANTCTAADDANRPIPTLVRQELVNNTMVERPLAEGVERMTVLYGLDLQPAGGDGIADRYVTDPTAVAGGWDAVVAVRIVLLVRSPTIISGYDDSGKTYDLDADGVPDFRCTAAEANACLYKRALFSQVFQVRNLAFRRGA